MTLAPRRLRPHDIPVGAPLDPLRGSVAIAESIDAVLRAGGGHPQMNVQLRVASGVQLDSNWMERLREAGIATPGSSDSTLPSLITSCPRGPD